MSHRRFRLSLLLTLSAVCATTVRAQGSSVARYRFGSDTLRYSEQTVSQVTMRVPGGEMVVKSSHDAGISIRGIGEGQAQAWFDRIVLRQDGPGQATQAPATDVLIGKPFTLAITATGHLQTQGVPPIPAAVGAVTDLSRQFDDFLVTLPSQSLAAGVVWSDTVVHRRGSRTDSASSTRHIRSYRVERDTMIAGARGVVLAVDQFVRVESTTPMPGRPLQMHTLLEGEEHGTAVFVLSSGRLHSRERRGALSGALTITGGPQPTTIPQRFEYTSTLSLQASSR